MCGGGVKPTNTCRVGHVAREGGERVPYPRSLLARNGGCGEKKEDKSHGPLRDADRSDDKSPGSKGKCQLWDGGKAKGHRANDIGET